MFEIKVLGYLGTHSNIIQLIGANTASLKDGKVYIFLQLWQLSSLKKYLRNLCPGDHISVIFRTNNATEKVYSNLGANTSILFDPSLSEDLHRWSKEICKRIEYLAEKHVVHADLFTRNVAKRCQNLLSWDYLGTWILHEVKTSLKEGFGVLNPKMLRKNMWDT